MSQGGKGKVVKVKRRNEKERKWEDKEAMLIEMCVLMFIPIFCPISTYCFIHSALPWNGEGIKVPTLIYLCRLWKQGRSKMFWKERLLKWHRKCRKIMSYHRLSNSNCKADYNISATTFCQRLKIERACKIWHGRQSHWIMKKNWKNRLHLVKKNGNLSRFKILYFKQAPEKTPCETF